MLSRTLSFPKPEELSSPLLVLSFSVILSQHTWFSGLTMTIDVTLEKLEQFHSFLEAIFSTNSPIFLLLSPTNKDITGALLVPHCVLTSPLQSFFWLTISLFTINSINNKWKTSVIPSVHSPHRQCPTTTLCTIQTVLSHYPMLVDYPDPLVNRINPSPLDGRLPRLPQRHGITPMKT